MRQGRFTWERRRFFNRRLADAKVGVTTQGAASLRTPALGLLMGPFTFPPM